MTRREAVWQSVSLTLGAILAYGSIASLPTFVAVVPPLQARPVRFVAASPPAVPVVQQPVIVAQAPVAKPRPRSPTGPVAAVPPEPTVSTVPEAPPTVVDPGLTLPAPPPPPLPLPTVTPAEVWPLPESPYADTPNGAVTVVAVLVNDQGTVDEARLVLLSRRPLDDAGILLATRQLTVPALTPPLAPGQKRWLFLRLEDPTLAELP